MQKEDCVKSVQIESFFWSVFSCIRTEYGDLRPYLDIFHAVEETKVFTLEDTAQKVNFSIKVLFQ